MNHAISGEILAKEGRFPQIEIFFATRVQNVIKKCLVKTIPVPTFSVQEKRKSSTSYNTSISFCLAQSSSSLSWTQISLIPIWSSHPPTYWDNSFKPTKTT